MTKVVAHLACPSAHLRTPEFLNSLFAGKGRNAVLVPWQVKPENLQTAIDGLRHCESMAGMLVTFPHKIAAARLCDICEGPAGFLGAVNVIRRTAQGQLVGAMFDGIGYVEGLKAQGHSVAARKVLMLGAGGAASGIAYALVAAGVASLTIANRSHARAEELASRLNAHFHTGILSAGPANAKGFDIVINATSLGLHPGDALPLDPNTLTAGTLVGEVVMQPDHTKVLVEAANRGCEIHLGKHMIQGQLSLLADFFFDAGR